MTISNVESGYITSINGSLIKIKGIENIVRLHDLIKVDKFHILGEIIQIYSDYVVAKCFENTTNIQIYDKVINLEEPLSMELGPGLIGNIFDGIQRPLDTIFTLFKNGGLPRGIEIAPLSREKKWLFKPTRKLHESVINGDIIGLVQETSSITHKIMVPKNASGILSFIAEEGEYSIIDIIFKIKKDNKEESYSMLQKWPINKARTYINIALPNEPLITGTRVIDLLFPIARGGTIAVPGGFGTGKTVIQQSLAKWCDADVIVFVGCGERGNEIADALKQFGELKDPRTGRSLLERIVIIANTSNMPVSAREASIFSGVTIAEYYRDMGYDVALLADSTSRWAESLREISGLLEEMPAEEGYPAYLPSKLSSFYERAGVVLTWGKDEFYKNKYGSLTIIASVSPPAGDFSEPVTATTKNFVQGIWALDASLAYSKHYPAINWLNSYSNYPDYIKDWWNKRDVKWQEIDIDWVECRNIVNEILAHENELKYITQLISEENLPDDQRLDLLIAKIIREGFLIQNAFDNIDNFTSTNKMLALIKIILLFYSESKNLISQGFVYEQIKDMEIINKIIRINHTIPNEDSNAIIEIKKELLKEIELLKIMRGVE